MPLPGTPETRGAGSIAARPMPKRSSAAHNLQPFLQPARDVSFKIGYSMAMYRVYRRENARRQPCRGGPRGPGGQSVRAKDYEPVAAVQADSEYDAWIRL